MGAHIGIVACSAPGAALCYEAICGVEAPQRMGRYAHPEVSRFLARAAVARALGEATA